MTTATQSPDENPKVEAAAAAEGDLTEGNLSKLQREAAQEKSLSISRNQNQLDESERSIDALGLSDSQRRSSLLSQSLASLGQSTTGLFSVRENTTYKWQRARGVVGALEVQSQPVLKVRADMTPYDVKGKEKQFQDALQVWQDLRLRESFIKAVEKLPATTCCLGLVRNEDATIKKIVPKLNDNWCKQANKKMAGRGFKLDTFLWNWQNASGKAETNILLIRFYEISTYRLRRASVEGSIDFDLIDEDEEHEGDNNIKVIDVAPEPLNMKR